MNLVIFYYLFILLCINLNIINTSVVINTWDFIHATKKAFNILNNNKLNNDNKLNNNKISRPSIDAIEAGCNICEIEQCDFTVGYGGSPDIYGETTLDAMIMDGTNQNMGSVGYVKKFKNPITLAKYVMDYSSHSILVGDGADEFGKMMGFVPEKTLSTKYSKMIYNKWKKNHCQPNYYRNVYNQTISCPPYKPILFINKNNIEQNTNNDINKMNHDTIGMVVLDNNGNMAAGTSSNGANHKIKGRIGDAPIPGAGAYVDSDIGGAAATGDGDIMMRYLPSYQAVLNMKKGMKPKIACEESMIQIAKKYPSFKGGLICLNKKGEFGGAGHNFNFSFSVQTDKMDEPKTIYVEPLPIISYMEIE